MSLVQGRRREELNHDRLLNLALVRLLEIIGEAANRIPREEQIRYPDIPWSQLIGLRNRLIHAYDHIDFDILWRIISHDLPQLIAELDKIMLSEPR